MKKLFALAVLTLAFMLGVGTAIAVVSWPSTATSWAGVNSHLNALHTTDGSQFSKIKVVTAALEPAGGSVMQGSIQCPGWSGTAEGWYATGGGVQHPMDNVSPSEDYFVTVSGPTFPMGPTEVTPNGWAVTMQNPTWNGTDSLPTDITVYAICVT